jgi:hypothetical protein
MRHSIFLFSSVLCFLFFSPLVNGQGCSDAGFCSMSSFKPQEKQGPGYKDRLRVGFSVGKADHAISVSGQYLELNKKISNQFSVDTRITSLSQSGNSVSSFGLSDIYINGNYKPGKIGFTLGAKIPLHPADRTKNNLPLPMDYQSSLGTFDLLAGIGFTLKKVQINTALQQPLTQNSNLFMAADYPNGSPFQTFQSTSRFKRKGDILLRISYPLNLGSKLVFTPGLLSIYHLGLDSYRDNQGIKKEIAGSDGLTLNSNLFFDYAINSRQGLQFSIGAPFQVRDTRPDGLTRKFVAGLEYSIRF